MIHRRIMEPRLILALALLIVSGVNAALGNCPPGYLQHGTLCYKFEGSIKNWTNANAFCKTNGGQELVSWFNDGTTGRFLQEEARRQGKSFWIGLRDIHSNNRYFWMDNTTEYRSSNGMWASGEPSALSERCVLIYDNAGYKLNDGNCVGWIAFICKGCFLIDQCSETTCPSGPDSRSTCRKCQHTYTPSQDSKHCEKACEYNNPCWPGTCTGNYLRNCNCVNGFQKMDRDGRNHCQLGPSIRPVIETCRAKMFVEGGKQSDSPSNSSSTHCDFMQDFYGNFQPEYLNIDIQTSFSVNVSSFPSSPGTYQTSTAHFGVTDLKIQLMKKTIAGNILPDSNASELEDTSYGQNVTETFSSKTNLTISSTLVNGDKLCVEIDVKGGGYIATKDTSNDNIHTYEYDKTMSTRTICYIMDTEKPVHKSEFNMTLSSPFKVSERITRSGMVNVSFGDWTDPIPTGGSSILASGIEKYEVSVYDMKQANGTQSMGPIVRSTSFNGTGDHMVELNLTFSTPKLVCLLLEVKDFAENVGFSRRFVLYDSSSFIGLDKSKSFTVISASPAANLQWQTHHNDICLSWKDYFVNQVYMQNGFLNPIKEDPNVPHLYDQLHGTGELPINGTPNVHGIIAFNFTWSRNGSTFHFEGPVPNFLSQKHCKNIPLVDGETYTLNITAVDIVNNTYTESRTVSIDRSVPHINNIWLANNGYESLFVHGDENGDLAKLTISFEVLDPHSGIEDIQWTLGTNDGRTDVISKKISVNESDSCERIDHCICPSVGKCQVTKYVISLKGNSLKAGTHNMNYYFTIKATNHARLSNVEHVEILVDRSPPEKGVVFEGPPGSNDVDYTSSPDFMVHWHGFVDHESGIKGYRVVLSDRCLTKNEMGDKWFLLSFNTTILAFHEVSVTEDSVRMNATFTGKYHVTVVAINNAAQVSDAACSDGITRDDTGPTLRNLSLVNGRWRETLHCMDNTAWLLHSTMVKTRLDTVAACMQLCDNMTSTLQLPNLLPEKTNNTTDEMVDEFLCLNYDMYSGKEFIYLPNDHLELQWDSSEDESQVEEFYVGLGTDQSETVSPSLMSYKPTNKRTLYRQRHTGFSIDDPFYIFVKVRNKAGLETVTSLGPTVIDETPPLRITPLDVKTNSSHVIVGWENETFVDPEQHGPISSVFFQIESDGEAVTPLLEWNRDLSRTCLNYSGGCIAYPVRILQNKDTKEGRYFTMVLHVFNNAGHKLRTSTTAFKIPSKYPPGHGRVLDIDPSKVLPTGDLMTLTTDVSAHVTDHTLCCAWSGFEHHENVSFEIGVGITPETDTLYPFQTISGNGSACLFSSRFLTNVKYFVTIKSSCTGGATLSSSDGVTIVNVIDIIDALTVENGRDCGNLPNRQGEIVKVFHGNDRLIRRNLPNHHRDLGNMSDNSNQSFLLNKPLRVGYTYFLQTYENGLRIAVNIETDDAITELIDPFWYKVIPFSDNPSFRFINNYRNTSDYTILVEECRNGSYLDENSILYGHWSLDINSVLPFTFEIALGINSDSNQTDPNSIKQFSVFKQAPLNNSASIQVNLTDPKLVFRTLVRPCIGDICLPYVASPGVNAIETVIDIHIKEATLTMTHCNYIDMELTIMPNTDDIIFFQWTISKDTQATHILDEWRTVLMERKTYNINDDIQGHWINTETTIMDIITRNPTERLFADDSRIIAQNPFFKISSCTVAPINEHETIYICVKTFTWSSSSTLVCKLLNTGSNVQTEQRLVYEFDSSQSSWQTIKQLLNSRYIGKRLTELLDAELDFGNSTAAVTSAMSVASERNVTWYLMTSRHVPDTCSSSAECITSLNTTSSDYVSFKQTLIPSNMVLYSCVFSDTISINRESHVETLEEIKVCSDGFVVDTVHPTAGTLVVPNRNRYITDIRSTIVYWYGFFDNLDTVVLGYADRIKYYTISAGSQPGGDDLQPRTNVGHAHTYIFDKLYQQDGTSIFVTVTCTDQAGLETSVTSDLLILDTSAPSTGRIHVDGTHGLFPVRSSDVLDIYLSNFDDPHSGVDYFEIGIGSQNRIPDLVPPRKYSTNYVTVMLRKFNPTDGTQYFIIVQAVNRAGLKTEPISTSIVVDRSPPSAGHVLDGKTTDHKNVDYQYNDSYIEGHWFGFTDHHSGIVYYRVGLGSRPYMDDEDVFTDVGLTTNVVWQRSFTPGTKYFITVEACNGAGLCTQVTSDGIILDQSAPIPGRVRVGYLGNHGKYQSKNTSLHVEWSGFSDTESGIDHFEVCLGTGYNVCDVHPYFDCLLSSSITKTGLRLPIKRDMFATVKAYNKVGLSAIAASDAFRIDLSPPVLVEKPSIIMTNSHVANSRIQYDPSVLRIRWKFEDNQSPITNHVITLKTHHDGHSPIDNLELGPTDSITVSLDQSNWLHNGDRYYVTVTACNVAGLCTSARTDDVTIDSTPPHQGGFTSDLKWRNFQNGTSEISLSWHSFVDAESGIKEFYITVGRSYSGSELSGGIMSRPFVNGTTLTQQGLFTLTENLNRDDKIYLTVWSKNWAGLNSSVSRISVNALSTTVDGVDTEGVLEIEKHSCQPQYCSGDCTCAVVGKPCEKPTCSSVDSKNQTGSIPKFIINWGLSDMVQTISTSSGCLSAHWYIAASSNDTPSAISRYEYSIGLQGEEFGSGVFLSGRVPWIDVGRRQEVVHCLTENMVLTHGEAYVFYVRMWLNRDAFVTFNSSSILIDQTPPSIKKGGHIKDSDTACTNDLDIIDWMDTITGCWNNVFIEQQGTIVHYTVTLGTSENADDAMPAVNTGLQTNITLKNVSLHHGTKYFFTVTAYNSVGLHTTLSSDGFLIDMDKPRKGVVFNTGRYKNANFQSDISTFSMSWTGFTDDQSGIRSYYVSLVEDSIETNNATFYYAHLKSQHTFTGIQLLQGRKYYGLVKAQDAAGHESHIAISSGRTVDVSGPEGFKCTSFNRIDTSEILTHHNTSAIAIFTTQFRSSDLYKINGTINKPKSSAALYFENEAHRIRLPAVEGSDGSVRIEHNFLGSHTGVRRVILSSESADDIQGNSTLWRCNATETTTDSLRIKQIGRRLFTVTAFIRDEESSIYKVLVGVGSSPGGFQLRPLQSMSGRNNGLIELNAQHGSTLHVTAVAENHAGLKSTFLSTPIVVDHTAPDIVIENASITIGNGPHGMINDTDEIPVTVEVIWAISDKESGLQNCYCSFDNKNSTVKVSRNNPLIWLGYLPGSEDLMRYTQSESDTYCPSKVLYLSHGTVVYGTVYCVNNVGLETQTTTRELTVIFDPPTTRNSKISFITMETDEMSTADSAQLLNGSQHDFTVQPSLDQLSFEWFGFEDNTGIDKYAYRIREKHQTIVDWTETKKSAATVTFHNRHLLTAGKNYSVEVQAINKAHIRSVSKQAIIMVDNRKPELSGHHSQVSQVGRMVHVDWRAVFRPHTSFVCQFTIAIGTRQGRSDVADIRYTTDFVTKIELPPTSRDGEIIKELYISIECKYPNGLSQFSMYNHRLDEYGSVTGI